MNRTDDRASLRTVQWWYGILWILGGLCPPLIAVLDRDDTTKYWTLALIAALALAYAALRLPPRNPLVRPEVYLVLLVLVLGATAYLLNGGAAFLIVSLPQFWMYSASPRRAVAYLSAATVAILGAYVAGDDFTFGNFVFTMLGFAGGTLAGLWMHRVLRQSEERARLLAEELARAQAELAQAHQRRGAAEERERLSREIHDTLAQGFASIVVLAEAARSGLDTDPAAASRQLRSIERTACENLTEARILVGSGAAATEPVSRSLRRTLDRFAEDTGCAVDAELPDLDCDQTTRIALLRCTQESLANIRKHARASTVGIVLTPLAEGIELEITDDGCGFDSEQAFGFGLDGMRARLAELGGELAVTSALGEGTRVCAFLPTRTAAGLVMAEEARR